MMLKFKLNVKAIWDEYNIGFHLGFTFLCFASILMIPVWLWWYGYSIWSWFNDASYRQTQEWKHNQENSYFRDCFATQVLAKLEEEGIVDQVDNRFKNHCGCLRTIRLLVNTKKVNSSFLKTYQFEPLDLMKNWKVHTTV